MASRNGKIDILRFFASLLVVCLHLFMVGLSAMHPFKFQWFIVEFFFMLTGYFTCRHFLTQKTEGDGKDRTGNALRYTFRKFVRFLPFTTIPVFICYFCDNFSNIVNKEFVKLIFGIEDMPFEMLYLSSANTGHFGLFALWYISAMFLVFPIFCLVLQIKNRKIIFLVAAYFPILFYLRAYIFEGHEWPWDLPRAFAGLCVGILIFFLSEWLKKQNLSKTKRVLLSVLEVFTILVPVVMSYKNWEFVRLGLICYFLSLTVILSEQSYIPNPQNRFVHYIGKLSLPIYCWHTPVIYCIRLFFEEWSMTAKVAGVFALTLILSVLNQYLVDLYHRKKSLRSA